MARECESSECRWINVTQYFYVFLISYRTVTIKVFQFERTRTNCSDYRRCVSNTFLQDPALLLVIALEVAHLVAAVSVKTVTHYLSERIAYRNPVVVTNLSRCPVGVPAEVIHYAEVLDLILIKTDVTAEIDTPVLLVYNMPCEAELKTLVLGLTHVTILVIITCTSRGEENQQVLCGVQVSLNGTVQLTTEECEVETDVTGNGGLPLQVGVRHDL